MKEGTYQPPNGSEQDFQCSRRRKGIHPPSHEAPSGVWAKAGWVGRWFGYMVFRNRILIAVASLIWLIWRSGTQPRRLAYPCQQAAAVNVGVIAALLIPSLARRRRDRKGTWMPPFAQLAVGSVALAGVLFVLITAGVSVYSQVTADYVPGNPAVHPWNPVDVSNATAMNARLLAPSGDESVVAVNRNTATIYGTQPYGPGADTAYELIWNTVCDLHLGTADNPLADLVADRDGDGVIEVHIKPNHVEYVSDTAGERSPVYTHPATFRPLVDMAALAGAEQVTIGDASAQAGSVYFSNCADPMGLTQSYVTQLQDAANSLPGVGHAVSVSRVDMNDRSKWSWVDLGADSGETGASAYHNSGYSDSDLVKSSSNSTYFATSDTHGRPGPGESNCMGWLAIPDYLLDADVVIDLAKLKVHYYGVTTAILKNWVGATMLSTYDTSSWLGWCRVSHEPTSPTMYERTFGNDILWRELTDAHRAVLYWRDGTVHATPQRGYLCVLDAINCAERWHVRSPSGENAWHYWLNTMVIGVDPVAVDAVGARLQRFDFRNIPIINNAHWASVGSNWPLGTGDPGQVRVVGDTPIGSNFGHQFLFDTRHDPTWPDWDDTVIHDLTPPTFDGPITVEDLGGGSYGLLAHIDNGHAAFVYYGDDGSGTGAPNVVRLGKSGTTYSATLSGSLDGALVVAQDEYFNTASSTDFQFIDAPYIELSIASLDRSAYIFGSPSDDTFTVRNSGFGTLAYEITDDAGWLWVDPPNGQSTGEADTITVHYDCSTLDAGEYNATITVSDPAAINDPEQIAVTVTISTVPPDHDGDGDVDHSDFGLYQRCLGGDAFGECSACDYDHTGAIDYQDTATHLGCKSGADIPADPNCMD